VLQRFFVRQVGAFRLAQAAGYLFFMLLLGFFLLCSFRFGFRAFTALRFVQFLVVLFGKLFDFLFFLVEIRAAKQVVRVRARVCLFVFGFHQPRGKRAEFLVAQARHSVLLRLGVDFFVFFFRRCGDRFRSPVSLLFLRHFSGFGFGLVVR